MTENPKTSNAKECGEEKREGREADEEGNKMAAKMGCDPLCAGLSMDLPPSLQGHFASTN